MNEEALRGIHERSSHKAKEAIVRERGPEDIGVRVMVSFEDGCIYGGHPGPATDKYFQDEDDNRMWEIMGVSTSLLYRQHGQGAVDLIILTCEGYMKMSENLTEEERYGRGDFAKEYAENPDSDVREILMTCVAAPGDGIDAWLGTVIEPYQYNDYGHLVWGDISTVIDDGDLKQRGRLMEALAHIWRITR